MAAPGDATRSGGVARGRGSTHGGGTHGGTHGDGTHGGTHGGTHALNRPRPISVRTGERRDGREGAPVQVGGERIETVRETWLVEDRWWTERPLRRRYWEVVSVNGRNLVVFHDLLSGRWFTQSA